MRRGRSAVDVWGRGTNRVIEMCEKHGAPPPVFKEKQGFLVVTFRAPLVAGGAARTSRSESGDQVGTKSGPSRNPTALPPGTDFG
jgi:predicted HTH transcriptional regulator